MTIGEKDEITDYDFRVMDALEKLYPLSRSVMRVGLPPRLEESLRRSKAQSHTHIGRRPLEMARCMVTDGDYEQLIVVLPLGSTWRAVNAGYMFLMDQLAICTPSEMEDSDMNSAIRAFAHSHIIPLLDTAGEFSRYPFDAKIAFDLMFTLRLALTRGQIGRGQRETIDSTYLEIDNQLLTVNLSKRETRQLALVFKYKPLPM
jgi:hypothetical protein